MVLSIGVEIEEDAAIGWYGSWVAISRPNLFQFGLYTSQFLANMALSIGVENDTIEEDAATGH